MCKTKAIICDIDGCILDSSAVHAEIKRYKLEGAKKWLFFESFANNSKLVKFNRILGDWLYNQAKKGVAIIFLTARSENIRYTTRLRLASEFKPDFEFKLLMRAKDDLDPAHVCKAKHMEDILATYDVILAIDDEQANLDMFNSYGLLVKKP